MFLSAVLLFRDAYLALGQFEESLGHYSEALSYYSRMLQLQSTDKQILVRQGLQLSWQHPLGMHGPNCALVPQGYACGRLGAMGMPSPAFKLLLL